MWSVFIPIPNLILKTLSSLGVNVDSTPVVASLKLFCIAASNGPPKYNVMHKYEYLQIASDENGKLEFDIHKDDDSISQSDLITKWNAHKIGCSDCAGWSL